MAINGIFDSSTANLASVYSTNSTDMNKTMERISTGKKFAKASDDIAGYAKVQTLQASRSGYENVKASIQKGLAVVNTAEEALNSMMKDAEELKKLAADFAFSTDTSEKNRIATAAKEIQTNMTNTMAATEVDNVAVLSAAGTTPYTVKLSGDGTSTTHAIAIGGIDTTVGAALDLSDPTAPAGFTTANVDTLIEDVASSTAQVASQKRLLEGQMKIQNSLIANNEAMESAISNIDEARESAKLVEHNIRQQASISMISQNNMSRSAVAMLFR